MKFQFNFIAGINAFLKMKSNKMKITKKTTETKKQKILHLTIKLKKKLKQNKD